MSLYLAVSLEKTALRPLAKNLLRAAALTVSLPVTFSFDQPEGLRLSSGEEAPRGDVLLAALGAICPTEPLSPEILGALEELRSWICSVLPQPVSLPEMPLASFLQEVQRQSLFYSAGAPEADFAPFWKTWETYYPLPQHFHITGRSVINPVNQSEAQDYLLAHNKASAGVQSVDNAIDSLLRTIPTDVERILDIGSGPGYVNRNIPADYSVLAMDIDEDILRGNVRQTCVGDIMDIPLADGAVDLVMACDMLEHLPVAVLQKGLTELTRVSRKYLYLQVPFQEDPLMSLAHCPHCGHTWHVNHHKRCFVQQQLMDLLPPAWKPVCVNYTGNISALRTGIHETELAKHLDWKVHCVDGAVCPNCGARSTVEGKEELKLLRRLAGFDTEFPFPTYTEIGILFCREDLQPQLQTVPCPEEAPLHRWRNVLKPGECSRALTVYTGAELLPQVYTAGCTLQATAEGYTFRRDDSAETAWAAISFPPLQTRYTGIELTGFLSEDEGTISLAMLDGNGRECFLEERTWSREKAVCRISRQIQGCPIYFKLYFTARELTVCTARLTGGMDAPYLHYPRETESLLAFSWEGIRYQLLYPREGGLCLSHPPETWVQISNQAASRRERAIRRFAKTMNGEICSPAGEEPDNRVLMAQSAPSMDYLTSWSFAASTEATALGLAPPYDSRILLTRHLENPIMPDIYRGALFDQPPTQTAEDQRDVILRALFSESSLQGAATLGDAAPALIGKQECREILMCSLFAESVLCIYGKDAYGKLYCIKMHAMSLVIRMEKRVKGWLHKHPDAYQFLTKLGIKRVYVRFKRRKKR